MGRTFTATAGKPTVIKRVTDKEGNVSEIYSEPMAKTGGGGGGGGGAGQGDWFIMEAAKNPLMQMAHFNQQAIDNPQEEYSRSLYEIMANSFRDQQWDKANAEIKAEKAAAKANAGKQGGGASSAKFGGGEYGFAGSPNYDMANSLGMQRKLQKQAMADQLYMMDQQRRREKEDKIWKLAKLKELLGGNNNLDDVETTTQLVNHAGRWDPIPVTTRRSSGKDLLSLLMGAL